MFPKKNNGLLFIKSKLIICIVSSLIYQQSVFAAEPIENSSAKTKSVLFVYGGWEGHEPEKCRDLLVPWLKSKGYKVIVSPSLDSYLDTTLMSSIDLIIQIYTMSTITKEQEAALLKAVKEDGVSIAGWHGGLADAFRQNTEYQFMVGGQFISHPGGFTEYIIDNACSGDPIMEGIDSFKIKSEQYFMHVDPSNLVLATTTFCDPVYDENSDISNINFPNSWIKGAVMPYIWKRMYGKGKVFYSSIGHTVSDFENKTAKYVGAKFGIAVSNCTSALFLCLKAVVLPHQALG